MNRAQMKQQARTLLKENPTIKHQTAIYCLISLLFSLVVNNLVFGNYYEQLYAITDLIERAGINAFRSEVFWSVVEGYMEPLRRQSNLMSIVTFLQSILMQIISFGMMLSILHTLEGKRAKLEDIAQGLPYFGGVFCMALWVMLFTGLWSLLGGVLFAILILIVAMVFSGIEAIAAFIVTICVAMVVFSAYIVFLVLRYQFSYIALAHNPEMRALDAVTASKRFVKGRYWDVFKLVFSFVGWELLVAAVSLLVSELLSPVSHVLASVAGTLVVLPINMWLIPYTLTTYMIYYREKSGVLTLPSDPDYHSAPPSDDTTGGDYYGGPEIHF